MDKIKLIIFMSSHFLLISALHSQIYPAQPTPVKQGFGIHLPASRAFGNFRWLYNSPMAEQEILKLSGAQNSSIGLHYFKLIGTDWAIGLRMSWQHYKLGRDTPVPLNNGHLFQTLLCIRTTQRLYTSPYFEFNIGPMYSTKTKLHPHYINYSSPYDAFVWYRGLTSNLKLGIQWMVSNHFVLIALGLQSGTFGLKAHRLELEGPVRQPDSYYSTFQGLSIGSFFDVTFFWPNKEPQRNQPPKKTNP